MASSSKTPPPADLVAVSQVSRFHSDTLETSSNDICLKGVDITIGDKALLVDAELHLFQGHHYGLVGPNGVGKSTLLRCMGYKTLVGFPNNVRVLYVEQLEGALGDLDKSVLQVVMEADSDVAQVSEDVSLLENVLASGKPEEIVRGLRLIDRRRLSHEVERTREIATKRSGSRGMEARRLLVELEARLKVQAKEHEADPTKEELEGCFGTAQGTLANLYGFLESRGSSAGESKARKILAGLGFPQEWVDGPVATLSGGWRIRVALASALFVEPDVLLLDEPTNHLDLPSIMWLQDYINDALDDVTVVTVSHDRHFLDAVAREIIVLRKCSLKYYVGNFSEFLQHFEERRKHMQAMADAVEAKKEKVERSVKEGVARARQSGDDKRMAAMASKERKLERLGLEVNQKGHRFKLNRDRVGKYNTLRDDIVVEELDDDIARWRIPSPEPLRNQSPLVEIGDVWFKYPSQQKFLLSQVTLNVPQKARIGIVGANGSGKTTLMKLLVQAAAPQKGSVRHHPSAKVSYISQHHIDEFYDLPSQTTAASVLLDRSPGSSEKEIRAHLARYGIKDSTPFLPIASLSGGELMRVAFAAMTFGRPPDLLVLDEPTNHLDYQTTEAMITALKEFPSGVVVVSHDRFFIEQVSEEIYLVSGGKLKRLNGIEEYTARIRKKLAASK